MAAYDDKSPLETAIDEGRMEIWNIMREGLELSETEKLEQLCRMIVAGKMDQDDPWKEFKELLSSLPLELVFIATYIFSDPGFLGSELWDQKYVSESNTFW